MCVRIKSFKMLKWRSEHGYRQFKFILIWLKNDLRITWKTLRNCNVCRIRGRILLNFHRLAILRWVFTRSCCCYTLPWAGWIQSTPSDSVSVLDSLHFNVIVPSTPRSLEWPLPFTFSEYNCVFVPTFRVHVRRGLSLLRASRPPFTSQEDSWYSFLLKADSTPGPYCRWKG
jgi:hypothetical protein